MSSRVGPGIIGKREDRSVMTLRLLLVLIHLRVCGRSSVFSETRTRR
jgi:hypothetical protein